MLFVIWMHKKNANNKILKAVKFGELFGIQNVDQDSKMLLVVFVKLNVLQVLEMMAYTVPNPMLMEEEQDIHGNLEIKLLIIQMLKRDVNMIIHKDVKFGEPFIIQNVNKISIM